MNYSHACSVRSSRFFVQIFITKEAYYRGMIFDLPTDDWIKLTLCPKEKLINYINPTQTHHPTTSFNMIMENSVSHPLQVLPYWFHSHRVNMPSENSILGTTQFHPVFARHPKLAPHAIRPGQSYTLNKMQRKEQDKYGLFFHLQEPQEMIPFMYKRPNSYKILPLDLYSRGINTFVMQDKKFRSPKTIYWIDARGTGTIGRVLSHR